MVPCACCYHLSLWRVPCAQALQPIQSLLLITVVTMYLVHMNITWFCLSCHVLSCCPPLVSPTFSLLVSLLLTCPPMAAVSGPSTARQPSPLSRSPLWPPSSSRLPPSHMVIALGLLSVSVSILVGPGFPPCLCYPHCKLAVSGPSTARHPSPFRKAAAPFPTSPLTPSSSHLHPPLPLRSICASSLVSLSLTRIFESLFLSLAHPLPPLSSPSLSRPLPWWVLHGQGYVSH